MCGRYAASERPDELIEEFEVEHDRTGEPSRSILATPQDPPPGEPDWNMAPTKQAPVVLTRRPRARTRRTREDAPRSASCGCSPGAWCRAGPRTSRWGCA